MGVHMFHWRISARRQKIAVIGGITCLAITGPAMGAGSPFDGDYAGKRSLMDGSPSAQCPVEEDVSVASRDGALTFTDSEFQNFGVGFDPRPNGSFNQVSGRIIGDPLEADVANDICTHHWHLRK